MGEDVTDWIEDSDTESDDDTTDSEEEWHAVRAKFGRTEIKAIHEHYGQSKRSVRGRVQAAVITESEMNVLADWEAFKGVMWMKKRAGVSLEEGYKQSIQLIACIYLVNVHSSVPCEDGFHLMGRIKSKLILT